MVNPTPSHLRPCSKCGHTPLSETAPDAGTPEVPEALRIRRYRPWTPEKAGEKVRGTFLGFRWQTGANGRFLAAVVGLSNGEARYVGAAQFLRVLDLLRPVEGSEIEVRFEGWDENEDTGRRWRSFSVKAAPGTASTYDALAEALAQDEDCPL